MSSMTRRALRVYTALSELRPGNADVLDALLPFFEPILAVMNGKVFDPKLFALGVQKVYRWRFNEDIAVQFVPRLVQAHTWSTGGRESRHPCRSIFRQARRND